MNGTFRLNRSRGLLGDDTGRSYVPALRCWELSAKPLSGEPVDAIAATTWLQRGSTHPLRIPVGVIGPREASPEQLDIAESLGRGLAGMGLSVVCGGRQGVMEAVCRGVTGVGGIAIGLLPDTDPTLANPYVGVVIATGIGEARNALIARAALCLVAVGDSYGTLSEVALGRHFGKKVIGLAGAAQVAGVVHVANVESALIEVAMVALSVDRL